VLTVAEAAQRARRNPETVRRWIREGKLRASKVGTRHVIGEADLEQWLEKPKNEMLPVPAEWQRTFWDAPMPNVVSALRRSREGH
jgi:excisionase family DNA binding protein